MNEKSINELGDITAKEMNHNIETTKIFLEKNNGILES